MNWSNNEVGQYSTSVTRCCLAVSITLTELDGDRIHCVAQRQTLNLFLLKRSHINNNRANERLLHKLPWFYQSSAFISKIMEISPLMCPSNGNRGLGVKGGYVTRNHCRSRSITVHLYTATCLSIHWTKTYIWAYCLLQGRHRHPLLKASLCFKIQSGMLVCQTHERVASFWSFRKIKNFERGWQVEE